MEAKGTVLINSSSYAAPSQETEGSRMVNLLAFMLLMSIAMNIFVIWSVVFPLSKLYSQRTVNLLVANLALSCGLTSISHLFNSGTAASVFEISSCETASFVKHVGLGAFATSVAGIILERILAFQEHNGGNVSAATYFIVSWSLAITVNIPILYTVTFKVTKVGDDSVGYCQKVLLLDSVTIAIMYEVLLLILFHLIPVCIIACAIRSIREQLDYLLIISPVPGDSLRRKIRSIRMLKYYLVTFALVWLPAGVFKHYHRIQSCLNISETPPPSTPRTPIFWIVTMISIAYFSVTPLISLAFVSTSFARKLSNGANFVTLSLIGLGNIFDTRMRNNENSSERNSQDGEFRDRTGVENYPMDDFSRESTFHPSESRRSREDIIVGYGGARRACMLVQTTSETWV